MPAAMWRWLLLPLGLAAAGLAAWLLLAGPPDASEPARAARSGPDAAGAPAPSSLGPEPGPPLGDIDPDSRRRLERVLEEEGVSR